MDRCRYSSSSNSSGQRRRVSFFGGRPEIREAYRGLWTRYLLCPNDSERIRIAEMMDALSRDATRNDPCWVKFVKALPGYREFWDRMSHQNQENTDAC
jgi:hypothetical protein